MSTGLNGWFGRFLKSVIVRVAAVVDSYITLNSAGFVDSNFTEYANSIGSGGGSFWNRSAMYESTLANIENDPRANYEPTLAEEAILNKFSEAFSLVVTNLAAIANSAMNTPFTQEKITIVNELLQRFAVIKQFYKLQEIQDLSKQAIDLRDLIIEVLLLKIENDIANEMAKDQSLVLIPTSISIQGKTLVAELHPLAKFTSIAFGAKFQIYKQQKLELPPDETDPIEVIPVETTPIQTVTDIPVKTEVKKRSFNWILYALAGFGLYKADSGSEKKS